MLTRPSWVKTDNSAFFCCTWRKDQILAGCEDGSVVLVTPPGRVEFSDGKQQPVS
jgi:hypothetical protein